MGATAADQADPYEVLALRYATRMTTRAELYLNFHVYGEADAPVRMDYFFWLARNRARTVLIDTGFAPAVGRRRGRELLCAPMDLLSSVGVEPESVRHTIVTHAHYDHIGNLDRLSRSQFLVSGREFEFCARPYALRGQLGAMAEPSELEALLEAGRAGRVQTFCGEREPWPGIRLFELGGHTPGQVAVVVDGARGPIVLASDTVHYYEELELDRPFSLMCDLEATYRAYDQVREFCAVPGAVLVAAHDPEVVRRFAANGSEKLIARIA